jgi:hypothetical protein
MRNIDPFERKLKLAQQQKGLEEEFTSRKVTTRKEES